MHINGYTPTLDDSGLPQRTKYLENNFENNIKKISNDFFNLTVYKPVKLWQTLLQQEKTNNTMEQ